MENDFGQLLMTDYHWKVCQEMVDQDIRRKWKIYECEKKEKKLDKRLNSVRQ